ncbi:hypothetical protein CLCAR_2522 [Clostridium carboxidivorans P7]|uniref:hypothetical protein n=1 Tax=Clostridium carboxidivorans TaxID=217159 RepID=UPI0001D39339|nr:hypothetical protein [Clostridium carboxidivorans]EFG87919.1 hypothetical protein CLCAR_2522 [Clostridium carboxidivorans P7]
MQILALNYTDHVTGVYYSEFIEKQLIKISQIIDFESIDEIEEEKDTVLHVMTRPCNIGGHTRVVNNWINFDSDRKYSILINEIQNVKIPNWLKESVEKSGGSIILNKSNDLIEKAKFLAKCAMKYEKIVLHIHNQDMVPLIAFSNSSWKKPIYLYNHSDHKFWLGVSIADMVLDLTSGGMKMSIEKRGTKNNYVLPIPIMNEQEKPYEKINEKEKEAIKKRLELPNCSKIILSMADDYKYTNINKYNFGEFAKKVIDINPNTYVLIIGANNKALKWIRLNKTSGGRIRAEGIIDKEDVCQYMKISDVYVDSFPANSYTSTLEAINYNIPSMSLKTPIFYLDALKDIRVNSEADMIFKINEILNNKDSFINMETKDRVAKNHYKENWCKILNKMFEIKISHSVGLNIMINTNMNITDYERFMYETHKKYETFPIKQFIRLSFINKVRILFICRKEFFMSLKNVYKVPRKMKEVLIAHFARENQSNYISKL